MMGFDTEATRRRLEPAAARWFFAWQLLRLRVDRWLCALRDRPRVLATACWSFPIYSQTFVYQELTQLIRAGFAVRFIYSNLSTDPLPPQFRPLWRARRRLTLHDAVLADSQAYFARRMPDRIERLIAILCEASGMSREALIDHRHFRHALAFTRMAQAYGPHYVHSYFFYEGTLFAMAAAFLLDVPRGVSCYADHMLDDYELKVVPLHLRHCQLAIATSARIKRELLGIESRTPEARVLVKPNGINTARFPATPRREPADGEPFSLVSVCRIEPKKGLVHLVEAVSRLRARGINVTSHVIGGVDDSDASRTYHRQVTESIARLGLGAAVHLEGVKSEAEINAIFRRSHIFVAPFVETDGGDKDGIPTALLEGMAAGLPVVATNAGSIVEVIENGTDGVIVPQGDAEALATAIADLLADLPRCADLGAKASAKIHRSFNAATGEQSFHDRVAALSSGSAPATMPLEKPLVSVVIIFLNAERFITEAIDSVFRQTYDRWELILVDDGSTDRSTAIAREHAAAQPHRIRYLEHDNHQNLGASNSRNSGIAIAAGRYVAFLDADDVWLPSKLEEQVAILESNPAADMVFGAAEYWHGWTGETADLVRNRTPHHGVEGDRLYVPPMLAILLHPLGKGTAPCPSDLLVRREVFTRTGGFPQEFVGARQLYEDQVFLLRTYLNHNVYIANRTWIRYRFHPESCMSVVVGDRKDREVRGFFLDWLHGYLEAHPHLQDAVLRQALRDARDENNRPPTDDTPDATTPASTWQRTISP